MVDTQFNRRGTDEWLAESQGNLAIEGESAARSVPSIQWKPATIDQRAEMERQLATTTLWQLYMSQSAAHDEIHVASADDEWLAESQGNLAVFARRKFKAGELVLLPFNHNLVEGTVKRPVGAMPLEMVITPAPFWLLTKTQQGCEPRLRAKAPSQGKAASQGSLI